MNPPLGSQLAGAAMCLPSDLLGEILKFLQLRDRLSLEAVCHSWREISRAIPLQAEFLRIMFDGKTPLATLHFDDVTRKFIYPIDEDACFRPQKSNEESFLRDYNHEVAKQQALEMLASALVRIGPSIRMIQLGGKDITLDAFGLYTWVRGMVTPDILRLLESHCPRMVALTIIYMKLELGVFTVLSDDTRFHQLERICFHSAKVDDSDRTLLDNEIAEFCCTFRSFVRELGFSSLPIELSASMCSYLPDRYILDCIYAAPIIFDIERVEDSQSQFLPILNFSQNCHVRIKIGRRDIEQSWVDLLNFDSIRMLELEMYIAPTDNLFEGLKGLTGLQSFSLRSYPELFDDAAFFSLMSSLPTHQLTSLSLRRFCEFIKDFSPIFAMENLEELALLSASNFSEADMLNLVQCRRLRIFFIDRVAKLTSTGVHNLLKLSGSQALEYIDLNGTGFLTHFAFYPLITMSQTLSVKFCRIGAKVKRFSANFRSSLRRTFEVVEGPGKFGPTIIARAGEETKLTLRPQFANCSVCEIPLEDR